jgi:hypothetical protein
MAKSRFRPELTCPIERPTAPHPRALGMVARLVVAIVAFAAVQLVLRAVASPGGGSMVGSKLEHFERAAERYDTVFIGTSHVFRSFVPDEFDRAMAESGEATSSFNFGIQLPNPVELHYLLRFVLEEGEGSLERVFVQYYAITPQVDPDQAFIARNVYWHDWEGTALAVERAWAIDEATPGGIHLAPTPKRENAVLAIVERQLPSRWFLTREHWQHWIKREAFVARGKDVARGALGRTHGMTGWWGPRRGYYPLEEDYERRAAEGNPENVIIRRREAFDPETFLAHVERLRTEEVVWGDREWMNPEVQRFSDLEVYRSMVELARAAGIELVVVIMPSNSCDRPFEARLREELGAPLIQFNLPDAYPWFYDPELRFDSGHLTAEGALEFTRVLAKEYLSLPRGG